MTRKTMPSNRTPAGSELSRRAFLQSAAVGTASLVVACQLPMKSSVSGASAQRANAAANAFSPNAFVEVGEDDTVTVVVKHIEFGQGPLTGLATLVAEELDVEWSQVRARLAPANVKLYAHTFGPMQLTGGSTAIANSYTQMRTAGATARAMLVEAAAQQWQVDAAELRVEAGVVVEPKSGKRLRYGELVAAASQLSIPEEVALKDPKDFKLIGTRLPKLDTAEKTMGETLYTIDVDRPGLWNVLVAHPPRFGAKVARVDSEKAKAIPGVMAVETIEEGVAVYARGFWSAKKGRDALEIEWDESAAEKRGTDEILGEYRTLATARGAVAGTRGEVEAAFAEADRVIESDFVFPYLAHAPMEPLDCVIEKRGEGYEIWMGAQSASRDRAAFAEELGVDLEQIELHVMFAGGSFGRRAQQNAQFAREAAHAMKAIGARAPIKLLWTREDDIRGGFYRPMYFHRLKGALDAAGQITAWQQVIVGQSVQQGRPAGDIPIDHKVENTSVEGASDLSYAVPNLDVTLHTTNVGVPVLWWRSVGHTHTGFTSETFIDELLVAGGQDPVAGRLALLGELPRHKAALEMVAEMADWGGEVPAGRARGVAVHKSFGTVVAEVAEVSRTKAGTPKVERVWCAVDCGVAVNPDIVKAQMEGGIGYGLGAALLNAIHLEEGRVVESNFHDYRPLRIDEMPEVEVRVITSAERPSGAGEPGTPPIAPAVANAWAALTGERLRTLPYGLPSA